MVLAGGGEVGPAPLDAAGRRPPRSDEGVVRYDGETDGCAGMTAAWLWVRADLRRRWRSWVVLGLLAGISVGLACAGVAGARRTDHAVPNYVAASHVPDAAVLANDPSFDAAQQANVSHLPNVTGVFPFIVPFASTISKPAGMDSPLVPATRQAMFRMLGVLVEGRAPNPARGDEIVVNQAARKKFGLDIGSTVTMVQKSVGPGQGGLPTSLVPNGVPAIEQRMRVVGISHSPDNQVDATPSSGFYAKHRTDLLGVENQFVTLAHGQADFVKFQAGVQRVVGHPVNVASTPALFGISKVGDVSNVERNGLLLFALAVIVGAGALVGQALVRAVGAGAADLPTWRAIGADRRIVVRAMVAPTVVTAAVGVVTALIVAIALSPRFPIALTRHYDLDLGVHADWFVLGLGALALVIAVLGTAWVTAEVRVRRRAPGRAHPSTTARLATTMGLPPSLLIGSRLAVESGQGRRAVPVRSALVGAVVGVLGVVACLTFRAGLSDTVADPGRSGVVWDFSVAAEGVVAKTDVAAIAQDDAINAVLDAQWSRAVRINGRPTPTFGTKSVKGSLNLVVLAGHAPRGLREVAFAPTTMDALGLHLGDRVTVGPGAERMNVVGKVLLPASSHTDYDESAWMTLSALRQSDPTGAGPDSIEDYVLVRFQPGTDVAAVHKRLARLGGSQGYFLQPAKLPSSVISLGRLRALPFALAIFFALLAVATVAHALVTTVRRRRHDLAVLRSIGFTRRDARIAIAWQSTLIAIVGLVLGVPLGIVFGRLVWKQLAENFPVAYVPPLALVGLILIVPVAIAIANLVAAGPAHAATRIRPARVLRTE